MSQREEEEKKEGPEDRKDKRDGLLHATHVEPTYTRKRETTRNVSNSIYFDLIQIAEF